MNEKQIAILYHGGCPDGFGGAYAAWKKFGDSAEYIPVTYGLPTPEGLEGHEIYFIDFCYPKPIMDTLVKNAASMTVLDHHLGVKDVVESMPNYVFDINRSGATIAWSYFHPNTPVPLLLQYVTEGDLWRFALPNSHSAIAYAYANTFSFEAWDELAKRFDNPEELKRIIERGDIYLEYRAVLIEQIAQKAVLVSFEGYECYLASATHIFASDVGNLLARTKPPLALVANLYGDVLNISLRSDTSIDISIIARKYGGNGHPHAAGFRVKWGDTLPWTVLKDHEDTRD